ncbi:oxygenase MpaB family protein [Pseudofrankia sp. DC12]|uniref:oxygenase MpaB family protein n=1 Tax=Pseudofrankia sp. DC12 TaxID=683315 RepID=UPI000A035DDB|nr:oxygenase MpaB family protein [Pseudofrankia sp. DC12]
MTTAPARGTREIPLPRTTSTGPTTFGPVADDAATPVDLRDFLDGAGAFLAGLANVVMQLSWAPVGHGVVESRIPGGQLTRHPAKRGRTTLTYIAVAWLGTDEERARYRDAVNASHRDVRSTAASPVEYNAFRQDLQLWVAACMYRGLTDFYTRTYGPAQPAVADRVYRHAARFGTTLQVHGDLWPADLAAFEEYWERAQAQVSVDPVVRDYLLGLVSRRALRFPFNLPPRRPLEFMTTGFLPARFRAELGLAWSADDEARFDRTLRRLGAVSRRLPRDVRLFPFNLLLLDLRHRIRRGLPLV